jgi:16S rRNA (guanine1207-N2)-methyltransferase
MSSKHIPIEELKKDIEIKANLIGQDVTFKTTWGLFSPEQIDEGTILLLNSVQGSFGSVLDIGCGYGPIGIALAKKYNAKAYMIDKDFVAVEYANKNAKLNDVKAESYLSNGFSHVPRDARFDLIISNLPAKVSKEFFWILFAEAKEHLNEGGKFVVVTIAGLESFIKKNFESLFGNYSLLKNEKGYFVAEAKK